MNNVNDLNNTLLVFECINYFQKKQAGATERAVSPVVLHDQK